MGDRQAGALRAAVAARALAARLEERGYRVRFPPGRDPAVFKVDGLPGGPDVEVSAGDDGWTSCYYTGRSAAEAVGVIARLPFPGHPQAQAYVGDTLTATWGGIEIEWHHMPPHHGRPAGPGQAVAALLGHMAVLAGTTTTERST
jgi:hypothetical protein